MKSIDHTFTKDEVNTLTFVLYILPLVPLGNTYEEDQRIFDTCRAAIQKLFDCGGQLSIEEFRVTHIALQIAQLVNQDKAFLIPQRKAQCRVLSKSIDNLLSLFDKLSQDDA